MRYIFGFIFIVAIVEASYADVQRSDSWTLPLTLSDANTSISFTVDSTWVEVHGSTSNVYGTVTRDATGRTYVQVELPVTSFDTKNESRDEHLREVMAVERFPKVVYKGSLSETTCNQVANVPCQIVIDGALSIRESTQPVRLNAEFRHQDTTTDLITADTVIDWSTYGVEDPSILIARLKKDVHIQLSIKLPRT